MAYRFEDVHDDRRQPVVTDPSAALAIDDRRYFQEAPRDEVPFILERGHGCLVWDTEGREYLDAHASAWLCQIGHGREEMALAAADQIRRLEHELEVAKGDGLQRDEAHASSTRAVPADAF